MFDNLGTAIVQAVGFFGIFVFFVYQLLSEVKEPKKNQLKLSKKKGLFSTKVEPIKEEVKPKKKGWFR